MYGTFGYQNKFKTKTSVSRKKRIAQILEGCQSLLQYKNVVQIARFYKAIDPTLHYKMKAKRVSTTPQMTCFRGAKVRSKWLQERLDDHNIQPDNKLTIALKVRIQFGTLRLHSDVARSRYRHQ